MKPSAPTSRRYIVAATCCWLSLLAAWPLAAAQSAGNDIERSVVTARYDIPTLPLAQALAVFGQQSGVQVTADASFTRDRHSAPLAGEYAIEEALRQLLNGSGLEAQQIAPATFKVVAQTRGASTIPAPITAMPATRPPTTVLSPLLVQAERPEDEIYRQPLSISRITREDIERTGPRHLSEILQATPGVFTVTNEQIPSVSINLRGLKDFGRVNMNIDGIRQNYQRSGHGQRNGEMFFDAEFLREVEIVKGAYTGAGGAAANAGVATFRTIEAADVLVDQDDRLGGKLRLTSGIGEYKNAQELSGSLALAARPTRNTDVLLAYSRKDTGAYRAGRRGEAFYWDNERAFFDNNFSSNPVHFDLPVTVVSGTGQQMESLLFKSNWFLTEASALKLTALSTDAEYGESMQINEDQAWILAEYQRACGLEENQGIGFCETFEYDLDDVHPIRFVNRTRSHSAALDYAFNPASDWIDFSAKAYFVTTRNDSERTESDFTLTTRTDTLGFAAANTSVFFTGNSRTAVSYGVEVFRDQNRPDADSRDVTGLALTLANGATPEGRRQISSVWLRTDWTYRERLSISPGLRWDHYRLWGSTGFNPPIFDWRPDSPTFRQFLWQFQNIHVDHAESQLLPTLGLAYKLWDQPRSSLQLYANAGLGWRPPAITETLTAGSIPFHQPPINTYPNWFLVPEKTRNWEAGVNWLRNGLLTRADSLRVKATYFHNTTESYIFYNQGLGLPASVQPSLFRGIYANATNEISFYGGELDFSYRAPRFYTALTLTHTLRSATGTLSDGRSIPNPYDRLIREGWVLGDVDANGNATGPGTYCPEAWNNPERNFCHNGGSLYDPMIPEWSGRLTQGFHFFDQTLDLGATLTCASPTGYHLEGGGNQTTNEFRSERRVGQRSFCVLDLYGSYRLNRHLSLGYNLKNLTDRQYAQAMGDAMVKTYAPGRTLTAYMSVSF